MPSAPASGNIQDAAAAAAAFGMFLQVLMPQIEARFRSLLEGGQFSWAPSPLPNNMSHPNVTTVDTACGLYLECLGGAGRPEQMGELVLYLDQEYSKFYLAQVRI